MNKSGQSIPLRKAISCQLEDDVRSPIKRPRLPSLASLRAFEAAARLGSFKQAADELAVTPTAVSHRIRDLEENLGVALFARGARAVVLTAAGQTLASGVGTGFRSIAAAVAQVRRPTRPTIRLSATPAFATMWLIPRLADWQRAHPDIDLHIHASDAAVDLGDGSVDLVIRYGLGRHDSPDSVRLLEDHFVPVASPSVLKTLVADPARWPLIHFAWYRPPPLDLGWTAWARGAGLDPTAFTSGIRYSEESHAIQAAIAGQGVALVGRVLIGQAVTRGLLGIASPLVLEGMAYRLLRAANLPPSTAVTQVAQWLIAEAGKG